MPLEAALVAGLVLAVFAAFLWERFPPEVVALAAVALLLLSGILETGAFLSVFSNGAPITIAMMFILSAALERTGVVQSLGVLLRRAARGSYFRAMLLMMGVVVVTSAFMNNTPIVLLLTPAVIALGNSLQVAPSKLLIPLSFSAIFGGTLTLVGTSTNILMGTVAAGSGQPPIGMFEMTAPGLIFAAVGMAYMLIAGRFLLPSRSSLAGLLQGLPKRQFIAEILVPRSSSYVGKALAEIKVGGNHSRILDVLRGDRSLRHELESLKLEPGDRLVIETHVGEMIGLKDNGQIEFKSQAENYIPVAADETVLMEASIGTRSRLLGRHLNELGLRRKYGVYVLAIHRNDRNISQEFESLNLRFGDTLLLEGPAAGIKRLLDEGDIINLSAPQERPVRREKAPIAILTIIAVMALSAFNVMPIAGLSIIGAVLVMLTGCVDSDEAFDAIDWRILFLIFGMLGLSMAMEQSGAAKILVDAVVGLVAHIGPLGMLAVIYALTSLLTEMISNNAVAVLLGPIVISLALQLGYDPRAFIMAVMFAASASFATPIGYQTNSFVYGAGGYKFVDFVKVGLPLNIIFVLIAVIVLPIFFPF